MDPHQRVIFPFHAKNSAFLAHNLKQNGFDISVKHDAESNFKFTVATSNDQEFNSIADLNVQRYGVPLVSQNIDIENQKILKEEVFVLGKLREVDAHSTTDVPQKAGNLKGFALQIAEPDSYFVQKNELADTRQGAAHKPLGSQGWFANQPHQQTQLDDLVSKGFGTQTKETGFVPDFHAIKQNEYMLGSLSASQLGTLHSACFVDMESTYNTSLEKMHEDEALSHAEQSEAGRALPFITERMAEKTANLESSLEAHAERYEAMKAEREEFKSSGSAEEEAEA